MPPDIGGGGGAPGGGPGRGATGGTAAVKDAQHAWQNWFPSGFWVPQREQAMAI